MSVKHPIISVTGASGAGTSTVRHTFDQIFRREGVDEVMVGGDAFHRYNRDDIDAAMHAAEAARNPNFSQFGPEANLFKELEALFAQYAETGQGRFRHYVHTDEEAEALGAAPWTFTDWRDLSQPSDLLLYEGLHGALITEDVNIARHADLKIGVVPVINLEWIQKIHRDKAARGYSTEAVTDTILRRMPDYINYICPQFTETDINFQRVPTVDTSNPFIARLIPTLDESLVVIRFRDPHGIDFAYLISMIHDSFRSRANSIVIPGNKLDLGMQLILTPLINRLIERKRRAS